MSKLFKVLIKVFYQPGNCNKINLVPWKSVIRKNRVQLTHYLRDAPINRYRYINLPIAKTVLALNILTWLGFQKEDEEQESELIMILKRAVLCTKREQFDKAEQLLHLALRLAQQQQNQQGITYCYDLMANVAFSKVELDKAQKLFVNVLQRILADGVDQDDLKVIHISLKLARILQMKAESDKAELGYEFCLERINKSKDVDSDALILSGVIHDWYSQFLLEKGDVAKALIHLKEAYKACCKAQGENSEQSMLLLNDLGIISWRLDDLDAAHKFLTEAVNIGNSIEDKSHIGAVYANLGLIYLQKGIVKDAEKYCKEAWHLGQRCENNEAMEQANYCFDQIKEHLAK